MTPKPSRGAAVLLAEMAKRGLTQADVATAIGCDDGHLSRVLSGKRHIGLEYAVKIRDQYGIDPDLWLPKPRAA